MKEVRVARKLDKKIEQAFPNPQEQSKITSYSGTILALAGIIFVACFGLFLYGVLN